MLIDKLIEDFESNESMFNLLVRYKGPEMFIERCVFQRKMIEEGKLMDKIRNCKPLNIGKLMNWINQMKEEKKMRDGESMLDEVMGNNQMAIEC